jgi:hypothetical protein
MAVSFSGLTHRSGERQSTRDSLGLEARSKPKIAYQRGRGNGEVSASVGAPTVDCENAVNGEVPSGTRRRLPWAFIAPISVSGAI